MRVVRGLPLLALSVALAACGGEAPTGSPVATATSPVPTAVTTQPTVTTAPTDPATTPEPTAGTPQPTLTPGENLFALDPPTPLLTGSVVRVTVPELSLRKAPFLTSEQEATLARDALLYVDSPAPIDSDGFIWYRASVVSANGEMPTLPSRIPALEDNVTGWFAAGTRETDHVTLAEPRCPTVINLKHVSAMTGHELVSCFGDDWVELEGTFRCFEACVGHAFGEYSPEWLAHPVSYDFIFAGTSHDFFLMLRFPPGIEKPEVGTNIRVRGHMLDAAAATCSMTINYWWEGEGEVYYPVDPAIPQHICGQEFVVERFEAV